MLQTFIRLAHERTAQTGSTQTGSTQTESTQTVWNRNGVLQTRRNRIGRAAALLLIFVLLLTGCGGQGIPAAPSVAGQKETVQTSAAPDTALTAAEMESASAQKVVGGSTAGKDSGAAPGETQDTVPESGSAEAVTSIAAHSDDTILFWTKDSPGMASIVSYVKSVTDKTSPEYLPPQERIAVFDLDGTICGERFPTYFDQSLMLYRLLHDVSYNPDPETKAYAEALEYALLHGEPEPEKPRSTAQITAESFKGLDVEEYGEYIEEFLKQPVAGFNNMTYRESLFSPMVALIKYLSDHKFRVFICSGTERTLVRKLTGYMLSEWIPPNQVIGSTFSLKAARQGDTDGRKYDYAEDDEVLLGGDLLIKNQRMNKVISIVNEIGMPPALVFGNSDSDFSMAQYALQNGGKAYMLLSDDDVRDYGDPEEAAQFKEQCEDRGFETISIRDEFVTIYGEGVVKTQYLP